MFFQASASGLNAAGRAERPTPPSAAPLRTSASATPPWNASSTTAPPSRWSTASTGTPGPPRRPSGRPRRLLRRGRGPWSAGRGYRRTAGTTAGTGRPPGTIRGRNLWRNRRRITRRRARLRCRWIRSTRRRGSPLIRLRQRAGILLVSWVLRLFLMGNLFRISLIKILFLLLLLLLFVEQPSCKK